MDLVNKVLDWENGDMNPEEEDSFFQELVDSGMAWQLQGMYGRRAVQLLQDGRIHRHDSR